jgi:hypothetical protein
MDVVPKEVSVEAFHPTAIQAQAIAARSYAYWHIRQGSTINNSTQFQVFVPYAFEALPPITFPDNLDNPCASSNLNNNQRIVCNAVAARYYIAYGSYPNDNLPAFTEYFADIRNRTISGGQPYLVAVDDPISSHPDIVQDGHGRGISQKGASRWVRGNLSFSINRDLGAWSVRWERVEQILVQLLHWRSYPRRRQQQCFAEPVLPLEPLANQLGHAGQPSAHDVSREHVSHFCGSAEHRPFRLDVRLSQLQL